MTEQHKDPRKQQEKKPEHQKPLPPKPGQQHEKVEATLPGQQPERIQNPNPNR